MLELKHSLEEEYGYLGIDMSDRNIDDEEEVEICGYPADKQNKTMWHAFG